MISCLFDLTKRESYEIHLHAVGWMVDTLSPRERLCTLAAGLSSQRTVTVEAIVEAAATYGFMRSHTALLAYAVPFGPIYPIRSH